MAKESKSDVVMKLILVFFISLLSFSVGTFVGKKFSDNQHKLSKFEPSEDSHSKSKSHSEDSASSDDAISDSIENAEKQESDQAHHSADSHGEKPSADGRQVASLPPGADLKPKSPLQQSDINKLAEEFASQDSPVAKVSPQAPSEKSAPHDMAKSSPHSTSEHSERVVERMVEKSAERVVAKSSKGPVAGLNQDPEMFATEKLQVKPMDPAERIARGEAPEPLIIEPVADDRIPSSLPRDLASAPIGKFTVQVAAYPTEEEAQKRARELKSKGYGAFYIKARVFDKKGKVERVWYRVSVGLFPKEKDAIDLRKNLVNKSVAPTAMVTVIER